MVDRFLIYTRIYHGASQSTAVIQGFVPMALLEPTFADLIAAIEQAAELPAQKRRHWTCSARQIAEALNRPAAEIPARWPSVRASVGELHHARVGVSPKTLANHKSNLRAALRWYAKRYPARPKFLSPGWTALRDAIANPRLRHRLSSFMCYHGPWHRTGFCQRQGL